MSQKEEEKTYGIKQVDFRNSCAIQLFFSLFIRTLTIKRKPAERLSPAHSRIQLGCKLESHRKL